MALFSSNFHHAMQFEGVLSQPDPTEDLRKIIDPRLGDNYPIDSVRKVRTFLN